MKLPTKNFKVKIGPFTYDVIYSVDVSEQSSSYGSINHSSFKIFIDSSKPKQRQEESFVHEVIHGIFSASGLGDRVSDGVKHPAQEEEMTGVLGTWMYQFVMDNPSLFK